MHLVLPRLRDGSHQRKVRTIFRSANSPERRKSASAFINTPEFDICEALYKFKMRIKKFISTKMKILLHFYDLSIAILAEIFSQRGKVRYFLTVCTHVVVCFSSPLFVLCNDEHFYPFDNAENSFLLFDILHCST